MARLLKRDENLIAEAARRMEEAQKAWSKCREEAREDFRFESGDQWDQKVLKAREGRPSLTINRLYSVVQQIVGDQRQNRPAIKVQPVDSEADPDLAEALTGVIRNIQNNSDAEASFDTAFQHACTGGFGYFRINTVYADCDVFDQDIVFERIVDPFSVYVDPLAKRADKSDARYIVITEVVSKDEFESKYPKHEPSNWDVADGTTWRNNDDIIVAEYWYKEPAKKTLWLLDSGEVVDAEEIGTDAVFEMDGKRYLVVEAPEPDPQTGMQQPPPMAEIVKEKTSTYDKIKWAKLTGHAVIDRRDWPGKYIPIVGVYGQESIVEGELIYRSAIRYARDAQRTYNWMRSTAVETIAQAPRQPFIVSAKQIENHEAQWAKMHNTPQPYLLYNETNGSVPQRLGGSVPDIGATQEAQIASDDIKGTTGIYDASLGQRSNETSGKAIMARQREGDVATYSFIDNLSRAIRLAGRILVDLIPKIYDTQRIVRILGEDGSQDWIELNKVVADPFEPSGFRTLNDVTRGKYDVVVNVGPSYTTKRVESAEAMLGFVQAAPQAGQMILDLVAKQMDWPEADAIAERLKMLLPPQAQGEEGQPDPAQQAQQQQMMQQQQMAQMQMQAAQQEMQMKVQQMQLELQMQQMKAQQLQQQMQSDAALQQEKIKGAQLENATKEIEIAQKLQPPMVQGA